MATTGLAASRSPLGRLAGIVALVCGVLFIVTLYPMVKRMSAFNQAAHFPHLYGQELVPRSFQLPGFPAVQLDEPLAEELTQEQRALLTRLPGTGMLKLTYAGKPTFILVKEPSAKGLPTLDGYGDWAKVLAVNEVQRTPEGVQQPKPGTDRLLIVVRRTPEGFDPETWGTVRRSEWVFDFYDLKHDGTVETFVRRWPRSYQGEKALHTQAASGDERLAELEKIPELEERSLEYFAALRVIPKLNVPNQKFRDTAFNPAVLGWTLPVSMGSGLIGTLAGMFALASRPRLSRRLITEPA